MFVRDEGFGSERWSAQVVFSVDPGDTTGWAWAIVGRKEYDSLNHLPSALAGGMALTGAPFGRARMGYGQVSSFDDVLYVDRPFLERPIMEARVAEFLLGEMRAVWTHAVNLGASPGPVRVVCEDFIIRHGTKRRDLLSPVRITSSLVTALERSSSEFVWLEPQSPANAKTTVTDERLRSMGLWVSGMQHSRDAMRHLVLALRRAST